MASPTELVSSKWRGLQLGRLSSPQVLGERWAPLAGRKAGAPDIREFEDAVQGPRRGGGLVGEVLRRAHPAHVGRRPAALLENGGGPHGPARPAPRGGPG